MACCCGNLGECFYFFYHPDLDPDGPIPDMPTVGSYVTAEDIWDRVVGDGLGLGLPTPPGFAEKIISVTYYLVGTIEPIDVVGGCPETLSAGECLAVPQSLLGEVTIPGINLDPQGEPQPIPLNEGDGRALATYIGEPHCLQCVMKSSMCGCQVALGMADCVSGYSETTGQPCYDLFTQCGPTDVFGPDGSQIYTSQEIADLWEATLTALPPVEFESPECLLLDCTSQCKDDACGEPGNAIPCCNL